ncbi:hypothetical protein PIROE2DRAFT_13505 [Piromyces sp. E2]|nr:hypothetical protein PIROE2DRAFT_13505 [Piromyces sp. E2]|eukprot:OUM60686.1 hypothetical protein PIROE2DRAFT_13505 [Piromyces sp. E2]
MHDLITNFEDTIIKKLKIDGYQNIIDSYIINPYFPWVCLILLLNYKNWKRTVILILVAHWFLRSTGDLLRNTMDLRPIYNNMYWPYSQKNWYISNAVAHIFWLLGEIIGDWYPLIRTKAVTQNKKKLKFVYITCIFHNMVKVFGMYTYFMNYPIDLRQLDENRKMVRGIAKYAIAWWSTVAIMQVTSLLYDLSVIFALKTCLFNKINEYKIYVASDSGIEQLRQVVLNFNYTLMYIDQILLIIFIRKNNSNKSNKSFSYIRKMKLNAHNYSSHSKMDSDYYDGNFSTHSTKSLYSYVSVTSPKSTYSHISVTSPKSMYSHISATSLKQSKSNTNINDYYSHKTFGNSSTNDNHLFYEIKEINDNFIINKYNEDTPSYNTNSWSKKSMISNIKPFDYY